jgi:hypothetical protein
MKEWEAIREVINIRNNNATEKMAMEYKESVEGRYGRNNPRNLTQRD